MKARIEDETVVIYGELPTTFKSVLGLILSGYETLSNEIHQADGFYDVVTIEYDFYTQTLSPIFFDEINKVFTYNVIQREVPIPRPVKSVLTPLEFLNRFTTEEIKTILALSKTDADVEVWWLKYNKARDLDLNNQQTVEGVNMLEAAGLIAPGRAEEILTKYPI